MAKYLSPAGEPVLTMVEFNAAVAAGMWQPASGLAELSHFAREVALVREDHDVDSEPFPPMPKVDALIATFHRASHLQDATDLTADICGVELVVPADGGLR